MQRQKKRPKRLISAGAVDLHFHGAFGIDLMTAEAPELNRLARELGQHGVSAFCPTTLSAASEALEAAVARLGSWIQSAHRLSPQDARPLGIHLEGPFIHPEACGAHPLGILRPLTLAELERLWTASQSTLKILTVAPETLSRDLALKLKAWCQKRQIILSIGHSRATQAQAETAFAQGFSGVTHAWNALGFHHRSPGVLGAALGRPKTHIEVILDGIHVDPTVIRWTRALHPRGVCFVSDCTPAAATPAGSWHPFGDLRVRVSDGASRTDDGGLAGGGSLLPDAFCRWLGQESLSTGRPLASLLQESLPSLTFEPWVALGIRPKPSAVQLEWTLQPGRLQMQVLLKSSR